MAYLLKSRHGIYYFRIAVPERHRKALGRGEIRKSLRTTSIREANRKLPEAYLEAMQTLQGIEGVSGPMLTKVLEDCKKHHERLGSRPKTIWEKEFTCRLLAKIVGEKPIEAYTKEDARAFRDTVLQLPPRFNKLIEEKKMSVKSIIKRNAGKQTITVTTFNNYIRALNSVFNFGVQEGYFDRNPFKGLKVQQKVRASSYKDIFSPEDIGKLFDYVENQENIRADRYWLTYLGVYTGARLGELCQLHKEDIVTFQNIPCIHFREGKEYQKLKNVSSERIVPVHSKLIELGFLDYVSSVKDRLFPMLRYSRRTGFSAQPSQWFSSTIKNLDIEGKVTYHSFRHLTATILKNKGIDVSLVASLLGHTTGTITYDRYGKSLSPKTLVPVVEAITLKGDL
ncbi:site-specific integrase [Halomonas denitrificans]|uniref:site-specific integrase n=1 Tax=Halomonas denitrificans TaxID=370769 RepID=UPI000D3B011A|nr:site-specific integrase [Halomonas denitrificans]